MIDKKARYTCKVMRVDDSEWEKLKVNRRDSGLSWNLFIRLLNKIYTDHRKKQK